MTDSKSPQTFEEFLSEYLKKHGPELNTEAPPIGAIRAFGKTSFAAGVASQQAEIERLKKDRDDAMYQGGLYAARLGLVEGRDGQREIMNDDKFGIEYDHDDHYRVVDYRHLPNVWVTHETFTQVEALTLMWNFEEHPERADQGYFEWKQQ